MDHQAQNSPLEKLQAHRRKLRALSEVSGRLGWDQQVMMPKGAVAQRGEESAAIEEVLHEYRTDPKIGMWLESVVFDSLSEKEKAEISLIKRDYHRATKVPASLASALARATAMAHNQWEQARAEEDWQAFLPSFAEVLRLRQEEGDALANGGDRYDALLEGYEPGIKASDIEALFEPLRKGIIAILEKRGPSPSPEALAGPFPREAQLRLTAEIAKRFGYDFNRGRIDLATHPFSSGSGSDVRITTRVDEADPFNALYSTIHEVGHAIYEQNVSPEFALSALGSGVSMGVHESQSRICENQLGRSRSFCLWLHEAMREAFGDYGLSDGEALYHRANHVYPGFIRTESDELHYNLHIMMRFDLERALISGQLAPENLEDAWNERFKKDFGVEVPSVSLGVLQDVHWAVGLYGYFPTYSLGNIYAGCLHQKLREDVPDLDAALVRGDAQIATDWLKQKLQRFGSLREPRETIAHAAGFALGPAPLLSYLEEKFLHAS